MGNAEFGAKQAGADRQQEEEKEVFVHPWGIRHSKPGLKDQSTPCPNNSVER
jgi:hypothetical protein